MGLLSKLSKGARVSEFAKSLAGEIALRYPPAINQDSKQHMSVDRLTRVVEDVCEKARAFCKEQRLGVIGKAKLGNALRWELEALGYRRDFVEMTTEAVIVTISR